MDTKVRKYNNNPVVITQDLSDIASAETARCISDAGAAELREVIFGETQDGDLVRTRNPVKKISSSTFEGSDQISSATWPPQQ